MAAVLFATLIGAFIGVLTGLAGRQFYVIGLWELAAGWMLAFSTVAVCHLLGLRPGRVAVVIAALSAIAWLTAHHGADAWAFRSEQVHLVAERGLLLADQAVLRDTDDPGKLVDLSLLGESGRGGVLGAARVLLGRGLAVHRALGISRVLPMPGWLHAIIYGLQAALVAFVVGRGLGRLADAPSCDRCGAFLRQQRLGGVASDDVETIQRRWSEGQAWLPELVDRRDASMALLLTRDVCPRGCSVQPGYSLLRPRRIGLSAQSPGLVRRLPARTAELQA